jgi:hypothetical protein
MQPVIMTTKTSDVIPVIVFIFEVLQLQPGAISVPAVRVAAL